MSILWGSLISSLIAFFQVLEPTAAAVEVEEAVEAPAIAVTSETAEDTPLVVDTDAPAVPAADIERPKSPWTPSYSVTTQGPSVTEEEAKEVEELEQLPPPVGQPQVVLTAELEPEATAVEEPVSSRLSHIEPVSPRDAGCRSCG